MPCQRQQQPLRGPPRASRSCTALYTAPAGRASAGCTCPASPGHHLQCREDMHELIEAAQEGSRYGCPEKAAVSKTREHETLSCFMHPLIVLHAILIGSLDIFCFTRATGQHGAQQTTLVRVGSLPGKQATRRKSATSLSLAPQKVAHILALPLHNVSTGSSTCRSSLPAPMNTALARLDC